ncbi:MAG TPA: iron ABC transporter permease, partial [Ureibacillus sp.]|nr:iron ABC transporter permease [Ureibacillus sp.]
MRKIKPEMRVIFITVLLLFAAFLFLPLFILLIRSFETNQGYNFSNYLSVLTDPELIQAFINSMKISGITAIITTILAFLLAY